MNWRVSKEKFLELDKYRRTYWRSKGDDMPRLRRFISDVREGVTPQTLWMHSEVVHTHEPKRSRLRANGCPTRLSLALAAAGAFTCLTTSEIRVS